MNSDRVTTILNELRTEESEIEVNLGRPSCGHSARKGMPGPAGLPFFCPFRAGGASSGTKPSGGVQPPRGAEERDQV